MHPSHPSKSTSNNGNAMQCNAARQKDRQRVFSTRRPRPRPPSQRPLSCVPSSSTFPSRPSARRHLSLPANSPILPSSKSERPVAFPALSRPTLPKAPTPQHLSPFPADLPLELAVKTEKIRLRGGMNDSMRVHSWRCIFCGISLPINRGNTVGRPTVRRTDPLLLVSYIRPRFALPSPPGHKHLVTRFYIMCGLLTLSTTFAKSGSFCIFIFPAVLSPAAFAKHGKVNATESSCRRKPSPSWISAS